MPKDRRFDNHDTLIHRIMVQQHESYIAANGRLLPRFVRCKLHHPLIPCTYPQRVARMTRSFRIQPQQGYIELLYITFHATRAVSKTVLYCTTAGHRKVMRVCSAAQITAFLEYFCPLAAASIPYGHATDANIVITRATALRDEQ